MRQAGLPLGRAGHRDRARPRPPAPGPRSSPRWTGRRPGRRARTGRPGRTGRQRSVTVPPGTTWVVTSVRRWARVHRAGPLDRDSEQRVADRRVELLPGPRVQRSAGTRRVGQGHPVEALGRLPDRLGAPLADRLDDRSDLLGRGGDVQAGARQQPAQLGPGRQPSMAGPHSRGRCARARQPKYARPAEVPAVRGNRAPTPVRARARLRSAGEPAAAVPARNRAVPRPGAAAAHLRGTLPRAGRGTCATCPTGRHASSAWSRSGGAGRSTGGRHHRLAHPARGRVQRGGTPAHRAPRRALRDVTVGRRRFAITEVDTAAAAVPDRRGALAGRVRRAPRAWPTRWSRGCWTCSSGTCG